MSVFDSKDYRRALGCFPTGVTVVTTRNGQGKCIGMTANSFSSVSLEPPLVLWSIARQAPSFPVFQTAKGFAINILSVQQEELSRQFATASEDKFAGVMWREGGDGVPVLADCTAFFECTLAATYPGGDHEIILGKVRHYGWSEREPLAFGGGRYARIA